MEEAGRAADQLLRTAVSQEYLDGGRLRQSGEEIHLAALRARLPVKWLETETEKAQTSLRRSAEQARRERFAWGATIFSALVLALAVYLLYSFINAGTKGHLAWPLRIVSMAAFLLLCLGLLLVRNHLP